MNEKRWVPLTNGTVGWVREHDPDTESGIAPMPLVSKPEQQPDA